jgi:HD-GYP domain-containing protein (c-di-GMP phosphodiesterase class II)
MAKKADRWSGRPAVSAMVSALIFLVPLAASLLVGWFAHRLVRAPEPLGLRSIWWLGQVALAALVFTSVERFTRRFLPLAALLKMTMVFPDRAPTRLAVARGAGRTKDLEARIDQAMQEAATGSVGDAAVKILSLVTALGSHDRRTRGHSERVRVVTDMIADELELSEDARDRLRWSSLLHDIGKLTVHPDILNKPGKPTAEEWVTLQRHPLEGAKLTAPLLPWLGEWALAVEQHHEKYDGRGYPYGLASDQISYGARVVAVADVFETMTAKRTYRDAVSPAAARAELTRCAGTHFDADIVRAFLNISLGRLRWAVGPASLIAQLPFLGQIPFIGGQATGALAGMSSATAFGAAALSVGSIVMPHLAASTSANRTPAASTSSKPAEVQLAMVSLLSPTTAAVASAPQSGGPSQTPLVSGGVQAQPSAPAGAPRPGPPPSATTVVPVVGPPVTSPPVTPPSVGSLPQVTLPPATLPPVTAPPVTAPPVTAPPAGVLSPVVGVLNGLLGILFGKR